MLGLVGKLISEILQKVYFLFLFLLGFFSVKMFNFYLLLDGLSRICPGYTAETEKCATQPCCPLLINQFRKKNTSSIAELGGYIKGICPSFFLKLCHNFWVSRRVKKKIHCYKRAVRYQLL